MNTIEHEASLCISLEEFCRFEGLPLRCAMELLHGNITEDQRAWLSKFVVGWEAWEERARIERELYGQAMIQLGRVQGSISEDDTGMESASDENIIGWMDDLRDRVGLNVEVVKRILQTFIGVRNGTISSEEGASVLRAAA